MVPFRLETLVRATRRLARRGILLATPDARLAPIQKWTRDGGEARRTARLGLRPSDVVLDFGGYRGDWTAELRRRYDCTVHVFEPLPSFAAQLRSRFAGDPKVVVHEYAVGREAGTIAMSVAADASGAYAHGPAVEVPVVAAATLAAQLPEEIALVKINIEGGEFELLPAMDAAGLLRRIERLFVQFHRVGGTPEQDRQDCRRLLTEEHRCDWDYPFVWESWSRRPRHA